MKKVYMMVHELDVNKGGMTSSMFKRSREFYDANISADIVTFDYKGNYDEIIKNLKKQGKMDSRTKMYNVFEYFKQISNSKHFKSNRLLYKHISERLKNTIEIEESKGISRFFDITTGTYIAYIRKSKTEKVIDFFKDNQRIERFSFNNNKVHMKETFNIDNKVCYQVFYDEKGFPYISRNINASNGAVGKTYLIVCKKEFKNNLALCVYYLEKLIKDNKNSIMICDGPGSFPKMFNTKHKNAQKYGVIHVNHHENFDDSGAFKKSEKFIIENADNINGVIVLTDAQRLDILQQFDVKNIFTI
ncbi:TPA: glycosyl transferase family 1, partial [Staphylococcus aureus]|nr:glycosyl transferase family 1 [Staphylococcus aureus]